MFEEEEDIVVHPKRVLDDETEPSPPTGYHWYGDIPFMLPNGRVTQALRPPRPRERNEKGRMVPMARADYYLSYYYMISDTEWKCLFPSCKI